MSERKEAAFDIGHPAPDRDAVSLWTVAFGIVGAPLAWSLQLSANSAIAGLACLTDTGAALGSGSELTAVSVIVINLAAVALGVVAFIVSLHTSRKTRHTGFERSGGVMRTGEGRTRFLAVWGIWTSILFLVAIGANTIAVFWRGLCPV